MSWTPVLRVLLRLRPVMALSAIDSGLFILLVETERKVKSLHGKIPDYQLLTFDLLFLHYLLWFEEKCRISKNISANLAIPRLPLSTIDFPLLTLENYLYTPLASYRNYLRYFIVRACTSNIQE